MKQARRVLNICISEEEFRTGGVRPTPVNGATPSTMSGLETCILGRR
jgi:hypothetical protein